MRGVPDPTIIGPEIPLGNLRRCTECKEYKDVTNNTFDTVVKYLSGGIKKRYWRSKCKKCTNLTKGKRTSTWWAVEKKARQKAATRLIRAAPNVFLPLFQEELMKEYKRLGLTASEAEARLRYRTRYVKEYIRQLKD